MAYSFNVCASSPFATLSRGDWFVSELTLSAFSSKRAKTGEVLQQAVAALNASNYSILLFCQLQLINLIFPALKMFVFSPSYDLAESHITKKEHLAWGHLFFFTEHSFYLMFLLSGRTLSLECFQVCLYLLSVCFVLSFKCCWSVK